MVGPISFTLNIDGDYKINLKNGNLDLLRTKGEDPCKYALKLLDKLFSVDEMVGRCYRRGPNSLDKPLLDENKVKILESKTCFGLNYVNYGNCFH